MIEPFEHHEPPPAVTPDKLGAGWPYPKTGRERWAQFLTRIRVRLGKLARAFLLAYHGPHR